LNKEGDYHNVILSAAKDLLNLVLLQKQYIRDPSALPQDDEDTAHQNFIVRRFFLHFLASKSGEEKNGGD